jgi:hypothetical protein
VTAWIARRGRRLWTTTVAHGTPVRIRGRVADPAGRPLPGAPIDLSDRLIDGFGRPLDPCTPLTGLRAGADGRFAVVAPVGPSRRVRIAGPGGGRAVVLTIRVRAPLTLRVARRGRGVVARGRLRGGFAPPDGALVDLQTRSRGRWVTRRVVRTSPFTGRFAGRLTRVPGRSLRAHVPRQAGLPYAAGLARARLPMPPRTAGRTGPRTSR